MIRFNSSTAEWAWMSNFSPHPIRDPQGRLWPTAEHLYQAGKCVNNEDRERIRSCGNPAEVKKVGRQVECREDWNTRRWLVMEKVLQWKFEQHPDLRAKLLATGDEPLVHLAPWDGVWGSGRDGQGQNVMGKMLEKVRSQLHQE